MRIGVVGCGYWGSKHARVLQSIPAVEEVVLIDADADRLSHLSGTFPTFRTAESVEEAMPHIDAAIVATPPRSHAPIGLRLLAEGKHVLIEKPLAPSVREAEMLISAAEDAGRVLMVGHTFEYNPAVWRLREAVSSGELGSVYCIDTARLNLGLYQSDVNVLWDLAPHDVSILNHILEETPDEVTAWGSRNAHAGQEDVAYLRLRYPRTGITAQIHVSWLDPCKVRRVTVVGSQRMAVYNDLADNERIRIYDKGVSAAEAGPDGGEIPMSYRYGAIVAPYIAFAEPLRLEVSHFVSCIAANARPDTDGYNGLAVVRTLEAAEQSLRSGRAVSLAPALVAVV